MEVPDIGSLGAQHAVIVVALIVGGILLAVALCCCVYRCARWGCCGCVYRCVRWCCCDCVYRCASWFCCGCARWCCCPVATSLTAEEDPEMEADRGRRQTTNDRQYTEVPDDVMRHTTIERFVLELANEQPIRFTAEQLAGFTRDYWVELGRGSFGTVYRGVLPNGLVVAVKVLRGDRKTSEEQFMAEMTAIGRTHHINLVRLYGFCFDDAAANHALVYEFMEHGALGDYLSARGAGLSIATAVDIATGVARGLAYLHEECERKIVHHDIKPGNVLLDGSLTPKVADFGLASLLSRADTHASLSGFRGTPGYAAPEVWREFRFTEKCDVYSFGILLLDIIRRGRKLEDMEATLESESSQRWFPMMAWTSYQAGELMELVGRHGEDGCRELVERMCKVAFWCVQERPPVRPSMSAVVKMLEGEMNIAPPSYPFQYLDGPAMAASAATTRRM